MGLERTIAVLQGTPTNYETDLFMPIIERIEALSGAKYGSDDDTTSAIRVIADHIRSAVFAIADGVMPSNIGRGYVLRRLIRNSVVKARQMGLTKPFMAGIVPIVVEIMGDVYPEIADRQGYIEKVIASEEEKFRATLQAGLQRLEDQIALAAASANKTLGRRDQHSLSTTPTVSRWSLPATSRRSREFPSIWMASRPRWRSSASARKRPATSAA